MATVKSLDTEVELLKREVKDMKLIHVRLDSAIEKIADVIKTAGLKSLTLAIMEVPCCSGLPYIVKKGMEKAGKTIPMETVVISTRGKRVARIV